MVLGMCGDEREAEWLSATVDPIAERLLTLVDPWDAYECALELVAAMANDFFSQCPHGGSLYVAWAELTDLFETGKTSTEDAHNVLRRATSEWLHRPPGPASAFLDGWARDAENSVHALFERDGDFWRDPRPKRPRPHA